MSWAQTVAQTILRLLRYSLSMYDVLLHNYDTYLSTYLHALLAAANNNHDNGAPTPLVQNHAKT